MGEIAAAWLLLAAGVASYENGPVRADLAIEPQTPISVAGALKLTITTSVPAVPEAEMRETGNKRRFKPEPPHRAVAGISKLNLKRIETPVVGQKRGETIIDAWVYVLEPLLPGERLIPELNLVFWPTDEANIPLTITTKPVNFQVKSLLPGDPFETELKPAAPPIRPRTNWVYWLLVALVIVLWAVFRIGYWKMRQAKRMDFEPSPKKRPNPALAALEETTHPASIRQILDGFVRERFGVEMSRFSPAELREHPQMPDPDREQLAGIKAGLDAALYAKDRRTIDPGLKTRIRQFLLLDAAKQRQPQRPVSQSYAGGGRT